MTRALLLLLVLLATPAAAQEIRSGVKPGEGRRYGGVGYFLLSGQSSSMNALDDQLEAAGFAATRPAFLGLGGGGYFRFDRWIVGGEGTSLLQGEAFDHGARTQVNGGYGLLDLGYVVVDAWPLSIYPLVGAGIGGFDVELSPARVGSFAAALSRPERAVTVSTGGMVASLGLGADWMVFERQDARGSGGMLIGLRAGYLFSPARGNWSVLGTEVGDGPDVGLQGFFVRLAVGGGGFDIE